MPKMNAAAVAAREAPVKTGHEVKQKSIAEEIEELKAESEARRKRTSVRTEARMGKRIDALQRMADDPEYLPEVREVSAHDG